MPNLSAIILAAGEGTRMKSQRPKVLHHLAGRPLVYWVLDAAKAGGAPQRLVVLGHKAEAVSRMLPEDVLTTVQERQLGTGHAVLSAKAKLAGVTGDVLVLCGDAPLIRPQTLRRLVREHRRAKAAATVLTAEITQPFGYGRIVRDAADARRVRAIVEEKDATDEQRGITEVNSGAYCFALAELWPTLARVGNRNRKGEYYLTDVVALLAEEGKVVRGVRAEEATEILGINSRRELALAEAALNRRSLYALMDAGVTLLDPASTWIEPSVKVGQDTVIFPGTRLTGRTVIGRDCIIGPGTHIEDSRIGSRTKIRLSALEQCRVEDEVRIGPFSHVRPGTHIATGAYIGNYAELNRSRVGRKAKVGHVSYLGDATVGEDANIGAGSITANYDGVNKHRTFIGKQAFIGSGTVIVAPGRIGQGALTGAGSVLKRNTVLPPCTVAVGVPARVIKKRSGVSR